MINSPRIQVLTDYLHTVLHLCQTHTHFLFSGFNRLQYVVWQQGITQDLQKNHTYLSIKWYLFIKFLSLNTLVYLFKSSDHWVTFIVKVTISYKKQNTCISQFNCIIIHITNVKYKITQCSMYTSYTVSVHVDALN